MEQFAKLPRAAQFGVVVGLGIAILAGLYFFVISGQQQQLAKLEKDSAQLESEIRQGREAARRADELQKQIDQIVEQLKLVESIMPFQPETGRLLRVFQSFARDQNLVIKTISPKAVSKKELYSEQPYDVEVSGGYHDLALFFDKIAHMRRLVNIGNLEIKGATGAKSGASTNAKFQTLVYMQNPSTESSTEKKP